MRKWISLLKSAILSFAIYMWFLGSSLLVEIDTKFRKETLQNTIESQMTNSTVHVANICAKYFSEHVKSSNVIGNATEKIVVARKQKTVRDNLIYIPELQQAWCLVPKAASTSWSHKIIESLNLNHEKFQRDLKNASIPVQVFLRKHFGNIGSKTFRDIAASTSLKKIVLTRHPFSRLISAFEDKLKNRKAKNDSMYFFSRYGVKINRTFRRNKRLNKRKEPIFEEFVEYLLQTDPIDYDEHWMPISLLCGPCKMHYNHIIRQEDLENPSARAFHLDKLGFGNNDHAGIVRENVTPREFKKMEDYLKNITSKQINLLYKKYEADFKLFSYNLKLLAS